MGRGQRGSESISPAKKAVSDHFKSNWSGSSKSDTGHKLKGTEAGTPGDICPAMFKVKPCTGAER